MLAPQFEQLSPESLMITPPHHDMDLDSDYCTYAGTTSGSVKYFQNQPFDAGRKHYRDHLDEPVPGTARPERYSCQDRKATHRASQRFDIQPMAR